MSMLMSDLNREFFAPFFANEKGRRSGARYHVSESEHQFSISMLIPGWEKSELGIEVENEFLVIKGELAADAQPRPFQRSFAQRFHLPKGIEVEAITATLENGVLGVNIPKAEKVVNKRLIEVA